jgi:hypothetical protein
MHIGGIKLETGIIDEDRSFKFLTEFDHYHTIGTYGFDSCTQIALANLERLFCFSLVSRI